MPEIGPIELDLATEAIRQQLTARFRHLDYQHLRLAARASAVAAFRAAGFTVTGEEE